MDPLRLLRSTLAAKGEEIHLVTSESADSNDPANRVETLGAASYLSFPTPSSAASSSSSSSANARTVLPKTTPTRFKRTPQSAPSEVWDLAALLLCYQRRGASLAEYAQEAVREGVELVGIMQRRIVNEYLEGSLSGRDPSVVQYLVPEQEGVDPQGLTHTSVESTLANARPGDLAAAAPGPAGAQPAEGPAQTAAAAAAAAATAEATAGASDTGANTATDTTQAPPPAKKIRYVTNKEDLEAYKRIVSYFEPRQISDRTTVLRGASSAAAHAANGHAATSGSAGSKLGNFSNVRDLIAERLKQGKEELRKGAGGGSGGTQQQAVSQNPQQKRRRQANPIIIISPSSSALITMYNVKRFLEESVYEPSDVARALSGGPPADVVQITRRRQIGPASGSGAGAAGGGELRQDGGLTGNSRAERGAQGEKLTRYFVVDGVDALSKFGDDAWDRVVCVMTTGQEWQFRPYKWTEPKELFHNVKGIYLKLTNDPPNPKIANWNVTELRIDPVKRHIDKSAVNDFWRIVEAWTGTHKQGIVDF